MTALCNRQDYVADFIVWETKYLQNPDNKVHEAYTDTVGPRGPHVGSINLAIKEVKKSTKVCDAEPWCFRWSIPELTIE